MTSVQWSEPLSYDSLEQSLFEMPSLNSKTKTVGEWYENTRTGQTESRLRFNEEQAKKINGILNSISEQNNIQEPGIMFVAKDLSDQFLVVLDTEKFNAIIKNSITAKEISEVQALLDKWGDGKWHEDRVKEGDLLRNSFSFISPQRTFSIRRNDENFIVYAYSKFVFYDQSENNVDICALSAEQFLKLMKALRAATK